jgi:putative membrane protein
MDLTTGPSTLAAARKIRTPLTCGINQRSWPARSTRHMKGVVMMGYGYSGGAWMWVLGCLITVMLIVLVGLAGWAFATAMRSQRNEPVAQPSTPPTGERDRSRQVLDERYARGEMTTDEYNERRQTLAK